MKNKFPALCEKIQDFLEIDKIPCLIITAERMNIPLDESDEIMIPRDFGKIEKSLFVDDLCRDIDKLDSLMYEIYEGAKNRPIKEVLRGLKWKYYLGKGYRETKKWLSSYSF